jgi:hypothetical protein
MPVLNETQKRWMSVALHDPAEALARLSIKAEGLLDPLLHGAGDAHVEYTRLAASKPFSPDGTSQTHNWEDEFNEVWAALDLDPVEGPHSHDADVSLALAAYTAVRESCAEVVVETGVARGVTSRVVLEGLRRNGREGRLISVDLPPLSGKWEEASQTAVPESLRRNWTYVRGTSRRALPRVMARYPAWDVFIHDSGHTYRNMRMEFQMATGALREGGWLIADDIEGNRAFLDFVDRSPDFSSSYLVGSAKDSVVGIAKHHAPDN